MSKKYNPKNIEEKFYSQWEQKNYFQPHNNIHKENYCIVMPPPNITGSLHLGHAFQYTIMDILIRYHRMKGKNTLWQPGIDHAGIATQILVEQYLLKHEKKTKYDYGREVFIKKIWNWHSQYTDIIRNQMKRLGLSAYWKQERFTMDPEISFAVKKVFIQLYEENLIYRGQRLINWDPKIQTAISDLEIETKKTQGNMWYLRYSLSCETKITDGLNYLTVATTRPETIFGDAAIAVHPNDPRYQNLIGNYVHIPITYRKIPIISDINVDIKKGTGCMKITPAHDFNDYKIGIKHKLPIINIFTLNGNIRSKQEIFNFQKNTKNSNETNYIPKNFHNINRFIARKMVIKECEELKLLNKTETYETIIPYSNRSREPIEPMITNQWYIRTQSLSKQAIQIVENENIIFIPKQYKNIYFDWMNNIQDWCISRQIWWGHRIPAWYDNKNKIYVGYSEKEVRIKYNLNNNTSLKKDEDVLDTWFSSGLWTFTSLGWPNNIKTLNQFHPTNVIVSGFDIIFFWIARMIMLTMHFIKNKNNQPEIPFKKVFITGLILDETGKKMSKSQGNVIDPLDIIDGISIENLLKKRTDNMLQPKLSTTIIKNTKRQFPNGIKPHGTDSLRFTLTALSSTGKNIHWDMKRLAGYHNFCNKLWHAGQFVLINTQEKKYNELLYNNKKILSIPDRWILTELQNTIKKFCHSLDHYRFDKAANILYNFVWNQFCNWYIEFSKLAIQNKNPLIIFGTQYTLLTVLETLLRLSHPIIPFITEAIWQNIIHIFEYKKNSIMIQPFPNFNKSIIDIDSVFDIEWIKQIIVNIRNIRNDMDITDHTPLTILFQNTTPQIQTRIKNNMNLLIKIANINNIHFLEKNAQYPKSVITFIEDTKIIIPIVKKENNNTIIYNQTMKKIKKINQEIMYISKKISNENFIHHAPVSLINKEKDRLNRLKQMEKELLNQTNLMNNPKKNLILK